MAGRLTLGIVGAGPVAQALGRLLAPAFKLRFASRSRAGAAAEFAGGGAEACRLGELAGSSACVVVAVRDAAVPTVAGALAEHAPAVVLHTCGSLGPSALQPLPQRGSSCATFHPLQSFPDGPAGVQALPGSSFGICGAGRALAWCRKLAGLLGGRAFEVEESRLPLYHAAAVTASNAAVGLAAASQELMGAAGLGPDEARRAIAPLMEASFANARTMEPERALTGPVSRGDASTVRRHMDALQSESAELRGLYRAFSRYLAAVAGRRGLPAEDAAAVRAAVGGGR